MDALTIGFLVFVVIAILICTIILIVLVIRRPQNADSVISSIQNLTQSVGGVQVEVRGLEEKISTMERDQVTITQNLNQLGSKLVETGVTTQGLVDTTSTIRSVLTDAQASLSSLHSHMMARQQLEQQTSDSIKRLESIIAGTQTKGVAGENIIDLVFSRLPAEWQARNVQIGNKIVEFGLRLPNNLILPIDSKWPSTNLLEQFLKTEDVEEQKQLKTQIEKAVMNKAKEVRKYIEPNITVNFGIAAIPDAVFDLCSYVQAEALQSNVVIISYSMFIPYLLLAFQTILRSSENIDIHKLLDYLDSAQSSLQAVQEEIEGRFSRAIIMLSNSRDEIRNQIGKINQGLSAIQLSTSREPPVKGLPDSIIIDAS